MRTYRVEPMSRPAGTSVRRPVRVVLFYGPFLRSARVFALRLDGHPDVDLAAVYCSARGDSTAHEIRDLWRRRRALAFPLFARRQIRRLNRSVLHPRAEQKFQRDWRDLQARIRYVSDVHSDEVLHEVHELAPDLALSYGSPILRPKLFLLPRYGTLGIHHGRMPDYRGRKTTFWEIWEGEPRAGVTIQRINEGIDTGQTVAVASVEIGARSYERIWNDVQGRGIDLYIEAVLAIGNGTASFADPQGTPGPLRQDPTPLQLLSLPVRRMLQHLKAGR